MSTKKIERRVHNSEEISYLAIIIEDRQHPCPKLLEFIKDDEEPTDYKIIYSSCEECDETEIPSFLELSQIDGVVKQHDIVERLVRWCIEHDHEYELFSSWEQVGNSDFSEIEEYYAKQELIPYGCSTHTNEEDY